MESSGQTSNVSHTLSRPQPAGQEERKKRFCSISRTLVSQEKDSEETTSSLV